MIKSKSVINGHIDSFYKGMMSKARRRYIGLAIRQYNKAAYDAGKKNDNISYPFGFNPKNWTK